MSEVVIEVAPGTIRGTNSAPPEWVSVALDCIDDEIALLDDHPVLVQDVWNDVVASVAGAGVDTAVVVCPRWWPVARIEKVQRAAYGVATEVVLLHRISLLQETFSTEVAIVEIATDIAVVTVSGTIAASVSLQGVSALDADAVVAAIGAPAGLVIDAPVGVLGGGMLASLIADRTRAIGVPVRIADGDCVLRATAAQRSRCQTQSSDVPVAGSAVFRRWKALAGLSGVLTVVVLSGAFAPAYDRRADPAVDRMPMTLLVEGRIAVLVPATWTAQRITSGPGSARVQVVSPTDSEIALHITQSAIPQPSTLATAADSLLAALAEAADGAFVEFNPSDRRGDREAVTYREIRPQRHVAWTILIDGTTRIAVGCQSVPGREDLVRDACDRAIRSAHTVA